MHPAIDAGEESLRLPRQQPQIHHIAGRPIIYVRQKRLQRGKARIVIAHPVDQTGVQIVHFIIGMGKIRHKGRAVRRCGKVARIGADTRRAHADDALLRYVGNQSKVEFAKFHILHRTQIGFNSSGNIVHGKPP